MERFFKELDEYITLFLFLDTPEFYNLPEKIQAILRDIVEEMGDEEL